jgi:hypothetical protein
MLAGPTLRQREEQERFFLLCFPRDSGLCRDVRFNGCKRMQDEDKLSCYSLFGFS